MKNNYMKNLIKRDDSLWMLMAFEVISCLHESKRKIPSLAADDAVKWKKNGIISIFLSLLVERKYKIFLSSFTFTH